MTDKLKECDGRCDVISAGGAAWCRRCKWHDEPPTIGDPYPAVGGASRERTRSDKNTNTTKNKNTHNEKPQ